MKCLSKEVEMLDEVIRKRFAEKVQFEHRSKKWMSWALFD
jgi:AAA+ superfamily predicted ATPase